MSLAKAILAHSKKDKLSKKGVSFAAESSDDEQETVQQQDQPTETYPNVTIFAGDYMGNLLGLRLTPPQKDKPVTVRMNQNDEEEYLSGSEDEDEEQEEEKEEEVVTKPNKLNALSRYLAKKAGIDPDLLRQKRVTNGTTFTAAVSGELHAGAVTTIATGGNYIVTGGHDECIKLCKRSPVNAKVKEFGALHRHSCGITASAFTPNGQLVLTGGEDGTICVWSTYHWDCIAVLKKHTAPVLSITAHPSAPLALSVGKDNRLLMWDLRPHSIRMVSASILPKVKPQWGSLPQQPISVLFSPNGEYYTIAYNRNLHIYNARGANAGRVARVFEDADIKILSQTYLDDHRVAIGADNHSVYVVDVTTAQVIAEMKGEHKNRVRYVSVVDPTHDEFIMKHYTTDPMPDNGGAQYSRLLVSADTDGKVVLWKVDLSVVSREVRRKVEKKVKDTTPGFLKKKDDDDDDGFDDEDEEEEMEEEAVNAEEEEEEDQEIVVIEDDAVVRTSVLCFMNTASRLTCLSISYPVKVLGERIYADMEAIQERTSRKELSMGDENFGEKKKRKRASKEEDERSEKKAKRENKEESKGKGKFGKDKDGKGGKDGKDGKFGKDKFGKDKFGKDKFGKDKFGKDRFERDEERGKGAKGPKPKVNRKSQEAKAALGTKKSNKIGNFKGNPRPPRGKKRF